MNAYKLTDSERRTKNNTLWGENISHTATGGGTKLCSDGFIHFYTNPLIAVLMNPVHGAYTNPLLWECETSGGHLHESLKSGCKTLTTIRQIPLPEVSITQKVVFAILCVKEVYKDKGWNEWADRWLDGTDRSVDAATAARAAAASAASAAKDAAAAASAVSAAAMNRIDFVFLAETALSCH